MQGAEKVPRRWPTPPTPLRFFGSVSFNPSTLLPSLSSGSQKGSTHWWLVLLLLPKVLTSASGAQNMRLGQNDSVGSFYSCQKRRVKWHTRGHPAGQWQELGTESRWDHQELACKLGPIKELGKTGNFPEMSSLKGENRANHGDRWNLCKILVLFINVRLYTPYL